MSDTLPTVVPEVDSISGPDPFRRLTWSVLAEEGERVWDAISSGTLEPLSSEDVEKYPKTSYIRKGARYVAKSTGLGDSLRTKNTGWLMDRQPPSDLRFLRERNLANDLRHVKSTEGNARPE